MGALKEQTGINLSIWRAESGRLLSGLPGWAVSLSSSVCDTLTLSPYELFPCMIFILTSFSELPALQFYPLPHIPFIALYIHLHPCLFLSVCLKSDVIASSPCCLYLRRSWMPWSRRNKIVCKHLIPPDVYFPGWLNCILEGGRMDEGWMQEEAVEEVRVGCALVCVDVSVSLWGAVGCRQILTRCILSDQLQINLRLRPHLNMNLKHIYTHTLWSFTHSYISSQVPGECIKQVLKVKKW